MRIVHVSDCYLPRIGGIERQVHDLAIQQLARGNEVHIVTSTLGRDTREAAVGDQQPVMVHRPRPRRVRRSRRSRARRPVDPAKMRYRWSFRGGSEVVALRPDVVHIHCSTWSPLGFAAAAAAVRAGLPTVVTLHSLWARASFLFKVSDVLLRWRRLPIAWSAVSSFAATPLKRVVSRVAPVDVVHNGADFADLADFTAPPETAVPRDPNHVVIVTVGRLSTRKRPLHLLKLLRQVRALVPAEVGIEMVLVGEGPLRASLQRYIDRSGMGDWVRLAGAVEHDEIGAVYERADIYVAPATLESFGIAALEARAAGLPVVAYAETGIADFIRHDVEGLLAADDEAMVAEIVRLICSPSLRERIRRHNIDRSPSITWDAVMEQTDSLYSRARDRAGIRVSRAEVVGILGPAPQ